MKMKEIFWPLLLIFSSLLTGLLVLGDNQGPVRIIFTFFFTGLCPGMALLRLVFQLELVDQIILAIACSFAIDSAVSIVTLYAGYWYPERSLAFLIILTLVLAVVDLLRNLPPRLELVAFLDQKAEPRLYRHLREKFDKEAGE